MRQKRRISGSAPDLATRDFGCSFDRFPAAYCLISLTLILVTFPFIEDLRAGTLIEAVLMTALLLSAVIAVGTKNKKLVFGLLLAAPALIADWESYAWPELTSLENIPRNRHTLFWVCRITASLVHSSCTSS
jgi:hypothetical protein